MDATRTGATPFVIWTLQRTGGTNLTARLVELSGLAATQHEPFNEGRVYGQITRDWLDTRDRSRLDASVAAVVQTTQTIKHCVETVPWEVTESLARATSAAGFRHLFLFRRNALDRLLSLHFAKLTGIWGPDPRAARRAEAPEGAGGVEAVLASALPVENLVRHERACVKLLNRLWALLGELGAEPAALAFEDIYGGGDRGWIASLLAPFAGVDVAAMDAASAAAWLEGIVGKGEQGTRETYARFPGVNELSKRLQSVAPFAPGRGGERLEWRALRDGAPLVLRLFLDVLPPAVMPGRGFDVGGVLVLAGDAPEGLRLVLAGAAGSTVLDWGQPSQRMAREHPGARNGANARWSGRAAFAHAGERLVLRLEREGAEPLGVAELWLAAPEDHDRIHREPEDRLVIDVGANDGSDTWFYLRKGFRVLAVEAIPDLADNLRELFATQCEAGRLVVEQAAVTAAAGEVAIAVNDDWTEWSSAHQASKALSGSHRSIVVPAVTLAALIERHGTPHYVKIDIEGGELDAVRSLLRLQPQHLPAFLSIEMNGQVFEALQVLWDLGYRSFQLVRQGAQHLPAPPAESREGLDVACAFTNSMSGLFGADLPEAGWNGLVEAVRQLLGAQQAMRDRRAAGEPAGWYDLHARRGS